MDMHISLVTLLGAIRDTNVDSVQLLLGDIDDVNVDLTEFDSDEEQEGAGSLLMVAIETLGEHKLQEDVAIIMRREAEEGGRDAEVANQTQLEASANTKVALASTIIHNILEAGANINVFDKYNDSALMRTVMTGHVDVVQDMLAHGGDVDNVSSLLLVASLKCYPDIVRLLLAHGADPNIKDEEYGDTPLLLSIENGCRDTTTILLETGVLDINYQNGLGETALIKAVMRVAEAETGSELESEITLLLLQHDPDVNIADNKGRTALFYAVGTFDSYPIKSSNMVKRLLEVDGIELNRLDVDGMNVYSYAHGIENVTVKEEVLAALRAHGIQETFTFDNRNELGETALIKAARRPTSKIALSLLKLFLLLPEHPNVNIADNKGRTALFYAVYNFKSRESFSIKSSDLVKQLLEVDGIHLDRLDVDGMNVYSYAHGIKNETVKEEVLTALRAAGIQETLTFGQIFGPERHETLQTGLNSGGSIFNPVLLDAYTIATYKRLLGDNYEDILLDNHAAALDADLIGGINQEPLVIPVRTPDGHLYELGVIIDSLRAEEIDPWTEQPLLIKDLVIDQDKRLEVLAWIANIQQAIVGVGPGPGPAAAVPDLDVGSESDTEDPLIGGKYARVHHIKGKKPKRKTKRRKSKHKKNPKRKTKRRKPKHTKKHKKRRSAKRKTRKQKRH